MKKILQVSLLAIVLSMCLAGCTSGGSKKRGGGGGNHWEGYAQNYMNKTDCYGNKVDDYHLETLTGRDLQVAIHHYLIDQHTKYLAYSAINSKFRYADQLDGTDGYEYFYTAWIHKDNTVTREHMWCCANSHGMWYRNSTEKEWHMDDKPGEDQAYWGGGSDIYQIRPTSYEVNNKRQNYKYYVYGAGETYQTVGDEGAPYVLKYNDSKRTCEVDDYFKGDVARTLMYIYMHYNSFGDGHDVYYSEDFKPTYNIEEAVVGESGKHTPYVCAPADSSGKPWLQFSLIMNYNEDECIRLLKQWNHDDPPSELEKQRNKYCSNPSIQGNRNPFIDYPDLVDLCFPDIN